MSLTVEELEDQTYLGPREAQAYDLRFRQGLSREEAGKQMGIQASTVQSHEANIKAKRERCRKTIELTEDIEEDDS